MNFLFYFLPLVHGVKSMDFENVAYYQFACLSNTLGYQFPHNYLFNNSHMLCGRVDIKTFNFIFNQGTT